MLKEKLAAGSQDLGPIIGPGPLGNTGANADVKLTQILTTVIGFLTGVAFIWFTIQVFLGGIAWISAGGDKGKVEEARSKITNGVLGVVIVISAVFIIQIVGFIFDIEFLNIASVLNSIYQL